MTDCLTSDHSRQNEWPLDRGVACGIGDYQRTEGKKLQK